AAGAASGTTRAHAPEPTNCTVAVALPNPVTRLFTLQIRATSSHRTSAAVSFRWIGPHKSNWAVKDVPGWLVNSNQKACNGLHPRGNKAGKVWALNGVSVATLGVLKETAGREIWM